jgi:multidrug resistance efflux pump
MASVIRYIPLLLLIGCAPPEVTFPPKAPLPVSVMKLQPTTPRTNRSYAGSVRSWKTEAISFEVSGRVQWVVEPGTEIEGRTYDSSGNVLSPGTQIAQLDPERFLSAVEAAKSDVEVAELKRDGLQIQIDRVLPTEFEAANAELKLATTELTRKQTLVRQNAGSRKDLDSARATFEGAKAKVDGIRAKLEEVRAQIKSAESSIVAAGQKLKDTQRDLADTRLYSAFRGQVSDVHVVPGSLASSSSEVVTVQMMNPIKVELEVSAETSRTIKRGDTIPVSLMTPDGQRKSLDASVNNIAASADNATRTFTLSLLVPNQKLDPEIPVDYLSDQPGRAPAIASFLWQFNLGMLPDTPPGTYFMPEASIYAEGNRFFIWRVANLKVGQPTKRLLSVEKLYVQPGDIIVPLLGTKLFRTLQVFQGQAFDPNTDVFAADVLVDGQPDKDWNGTQLILADAERWLMRPGDVLDVDLSPASGKPGLYVPVEAIHEEAGETSVFVVNPGDGEFVATKVLVNVIKPVGSPGMSKHLIEPTSPDVNLFGQQIIIEGVHYISDGESVNVVKTTGADQ